MNKLSDKNPCDTCTVDRQIGNPYRWQCECDRCQKPYNWKNECVKKLKEYEEIGTVEECRVAMERKRAKKPILSAPCKTINYYICPECKGILSINKPFCSNCGNAVDWGDSP